MNIGKSFNKSLFKAYTCNFARSKSTSSAEYCMDTVKQYDYENFICTLLLPGTARSNAFAIRGFNVEVARVAEQVSQANIGLMRLKFWEEAIDKCCTKDPKQVPQHPVAIELFKAFTKEKLTKRYLAALVSARAKRLQLNSFSTLEELEKYADDTVSNVYFLVLEGCGVRNVHADHAASHLGKAQGIVQQLRTTVLAKQLNTIAIPHSILAKNQVSQEEIIRGKASERLNECVFEVATRAHQHLTKARNLQDQVPKEARDALLPSVAISLYLERLQKVNYDIFHSSLKQKGWLWLPKLWVKHIRKKY